MKQMSMEEAMAIVSSMTFSRYSDVKIIDEKCPKCGGFILCVYDELGATDFYDIYSHSCLNPECDFRRHHESFTCNMCGRADPPSEKCYFCGRPILMTG
jgi:hypothetical protein